MIIYKKTRMVVFPLENNLTNVIPTFCPTKVFLIFQDLSKSHVSRCPGCCNKDSIDWMAYKQCTFISSFLEAVKSKTRVPADVLSGEGMLPGSLLGSYSVSS